MKKEVLDEQAGFLEFIKNYEYINEQGRLDLEAFCFNLSICFSCDGILDKSPRPIDMYHLLIDLLKNHANNNDMSLWVQNQKLVDWSPEFERMYPDKYRTCIHIAGLVHVMSYWVYDIGHYLMGIPEPKKIEKYFNWVDSEWIFVHTFINGFHNFFTSFLKKMDEKGVKERGYSLFEALHKSKSSDIDYDKAINELKIRSSAQNKAIKRIDQAISAEFYLEAITLEENLISNCLFNYLKSKNKHFKNPSFQKLLKECKELTNDASEMVDRVNTWRAKRNTAIHGFVESEINSLSESENEFLSFAKETSIEGRDFCQLICDWYIKQSINFIPTEFETKQKTLN
ncbi:hypothetical protein ABIS04_16315 [Shewanella sp. H8]|uniref:hypothetical protein n=1 Tax=Shewanella sp. H8 TaxID=3342676 RepID=UPI00331589D3